MKLLVIGGMHGNEPLGLEVVKLLEISPIEGVQAVIANAEAVKQNCRFVAHDLNRAFPGRRRDDYEGSRPTELLGLCEQFDVVLDFHNTHCPGNDCGFVGESATPQLYGLASLLGLNRVIVADYDCINKYAPNCLSVEISLDSSVRSAELWYERIKRLSRQRVEQLKENAVVDRYRFVYRMTLEDRERLRLPQRGLRAFQKISPTLATELGVASPAYPIFINDSYTPYNYGGILNKY